MTALCRDGAPQLVLAYPGDLDTRTGGYIYDKRLALELEAQGWGVTRLALGEGFPAPSPATLAAATASLQALPGGTTALVDGLAFGALGDAAAPLARHLDLVALVHHPLALETGLDPAEAARLYRSERQALGWAAKVVTTSSATAGLLDRDYGVPPARIAVARPGIDAKPLAPADGHPPLSILAVGSVVPRKDFATLVRALAPLRHLAWHLTIAGSLERSDEAVAALRSAIRESALDARVVLAGELETEALDALYLQSDLLVSTALLEGFGMAAADATAFGLPVVAVDGGATREALPTAAVLVAPGDLAALTATLSCLMTDEKSRLALRAEARAVRSSLQGWAETARVVADWLRR